MAFATQADLDAIEAEGAWDDLDVPRTIWQQLQKTSGAFPDRPAITFQMFSGPQDKAETMTWSELVADVARLANFLRDIGIGQKDRVALLLPNCNEAVVAYLGGMVAGVVQPINALLEPPQIAALLEETGAKALITLKPFPRSDLSQRAAEALKDAPKVEHLIEVDLAHYLSGLKRLAIPFVRPKASGGHSAQVHRFDKALRGQPGTLQFEDPDADRAVTNFHTGGTTGTPKIVEHRQSGILYNAWIGDRMLFTEADTMICPLPMFHVFAAVVVMGAAIASGAQVVLPTPQGYRGEGVFDNFWKLCERHGATFMIAVPTAISALMQRKVDADISKLQIAFCGSAPLPVELYRKFEKGAGVTICEGYGLTEATCLVSINPPDGEKKIGSVGLPFPHTRVKIFHDEEGEAKECPTDVIGEICVSSPGVREGGIYSDAEKNRDLYRDERFLRTGDLGRIDPDGYVWITGRAKDLIIRGGHNIDPAQIEDALSAHDAVAVCGAIGQPDAHSGELPCAYVELVSGAKVDSDALMSFAKERIHERSAWPKRIEILDELPKTAVGKVYKPDLRRRAITRVYNAALSEAGHAAEVSRVRDDRTRGLVALVRRTGPLDEEGVKRVLGAFAGPWEWAEEDPQDR